MLKDVCSEEQCMAFDFNRYNSSINYYSDKNRFFNDRSVLLVKNQHLGDNEFDYYSLPLQPQKLQLQQQQKLQQQQLQLQLATSTLTSTSTSTDFYFNVDFNFNVDFTST